MGKAREGIAALRKAADTSRLIDNKPGLSDYGRETPDLKSRFEVLE